MKRECQSATEGDQYFLVNIAQHMGAMVKQYELNVCSSLALLCKELDTGLNTKLIADTHVVRMCVDTPSVTVPPTLEKEKRSFFDVLCEENSVDMG